MNRTRPFRPLRRVAGTLAALAAALLAAAVAAPAAFALPVPPGGGGDGTVAPSPPVQVVVVGGMPGWQIALIAIGAAILAATGAVFLDRARTTRRHQAAPGT
jgi:membrane protein implicated in regulation of membrane protease activity